jgi:hypothetical protein
MRFGHPDMLKLTLRDIAQQTLAQTFKVCLRDIPYPQLDGKRVLGFDNAKAGDIVPSIALLDELRDCSRPLFGVVVFHQGTRVQKRAGHLTLITRSNHDIGHRTLNLRQRLAHFLKARGMAGLLGTPAREGRIEQVFFSTLFSNGDHDALMLVQIERL